MPASAAPGYVIPSRRTKKTSTAWADKDALEQLKRLAAHKRTSQQKLIAEAFDCHRSRSDDLSGFLSHPCRTTRTTRAVTH
jgi:hypothetical protein